MTVRIMSSTRVPSLPPPPLWRKDFHHAQPLNGLLAALTGGRVHIGDELIAQGLQVHIPQDGEDSLGAHAGHKYLGEAVVKFTVAGFGQQPHLLDVVQIIHGQLQLVGQFGSRR